LNSSTSYAAEAAGDSIAFDGIRAITGLVGYRWGGRAQ